jgi:hypothetical protein
VKSGIRYLDSAGEKVRLPFLLLSTDDSEHKVWHEIEQENSDLIDRHPQIVQGIELVVGETKPLTMGAPYPITRKREGHKPNHHDSVIDDCAPEKKVAREFNAHALSSFGA